MRHIKIISILLLFFANSIWGQEFPEQPNPPRLVNDYAGLLTKQQQNSLERKLVAHSDTNGTQIAIVIVQSIYDYDIADYSQRLAQKWKIGHKKDDNGAIIVLKPKTGSEKGDVNIDVGYGLEPYIPDITAKRIIENEMIPYFRNEDYYAGLDAATSIMMNLSAGHFTPEQYNSGGQKRSPFGFLVPIIVMFIIISLINRKRRGQYSVGGKNNNSSLWTAIILGSMLSRGSGSSFGNFSGGSGSFGGGSSGFGGFGGGSFGGGGASGSW